MGYISRQRIEILIKDEILPSIDFLDFDTCVDCIKGKVTDKIGTAKNRCIELLRVTHTDIYGSFTLPAMGSHKYFITFIDYFSHYGIVELIHDKFNSFKAFKPKVKLQQGKMIKMVHSDKVGEYYGKYDETRRNLGPFAKYLQECGIDA